MDLQNKKEDEGGLGVLGDRTPSINSHEFLTHQPASGKEILSLEPGKQVRASASQAFPKHCFLTDVVNSPVKAAMATYELVSPLFRSPI